MKTLVFVKHVPEAGSTPPYASDLTLDRSQAGAEMSGVDVFAVGEGVRLAADDSCVLATVGPPGAEATLRQGLLLGADQAIHLVDDRLSGADVNLTAAVLAAIVRKQQPDVVILGREAGDSRMGVLPSLLAELLGWPVLSAVEGLLAEGETLRARRRDGSGIIDLRTTIPAVVSAAEYANEPAPADLTMLRNALTSAIPRINLTDIGIDPETFPAPVMQVLAIRDTPSSRRPRVITENVVEEVLRSLMEYGVIDATPLEQDVSA